MQRSEIKALCAQIHRLLAAQTNEPAWAALFAGLLARLNDETAPLAPIQADIRRLFAGAGSFSDLVMQTRGATDTAADTQLDRLRAKLFELISS